MSVYFVRDRDAASHGAGARGLCTDTSVGAGQSRSQRRPAAANGNRQRHRDARARGYLEVLFKTAEMPLGHEFDYAMERYAGVQLIAVAIAEAQKQHKRLSGSGFRMRAMVDMQRPVDTAAGPATAAFTLVRLSPGEMLEGRIQMLTHHTETVVWQPRWRAHPNGALALASVMIAVPDVEEAAQRFVRFSGRPARASALGQIIELDRGRIDLVRSEAFAQLLPELAAPSLPFIGAYMILVRSLAVVEDIFAKADLPTRRMGQALVAVFSGALGCGAWIFAQAAAA